ncbi:pentatricopeptide repeat-containing protein At2g27610 [Punica granatum]|uniref:Pentatricopeptide repeat-containing protein At2g27610 n=2 Tax=Punica granatum TaxID=22663 RepID=A0A6P8CXL8_PUNGR|nr:pentatricopeptide repeat-containing protein At2g27610 [Punica granatum]XP_031386763.1 pentatricopeptide repeat-containing protein At2g27610 [Punica granatum]XP_031386764.1 pentatricopeptide repeat-containing protein At2g27610 [Punica granatum]OWM73670.1 hypothetical protein CDL15_Pgr026770 [Punica granatum]PKI53670.1 hypothetical protein CRG98_025911 [Punica granatum]
MTTTSSGSIRALIRARNDPTLKSHLRIIHSSTPLRRSHAVALSSEYFHNARHLFEESPDRDPSKNFNSLLFQYSRENQNWQALSLFAYIHQSGLPVDGSTLSCALKVCGALPDQCAGKQVHCRCIKAGFEGDVSVGTSLVDMYMKSEHIEDGTRVFESMGDKNVVSWTSLLSGYAKNGLTDRAVGLFRRIVGAGVEPNAFTFTTVLGALVADGSLVAERGTQVHGMVVKNGLERDVTVGNSLINMYSKVGMLGSARAIFDSMDEKNYVSWNGIIGGYVSSGCDSEALEMFYQMRTAGVGLTQVTFVSVIKLCGNNRNLALVRQLHCRVLRGGFAFGDGVRTALMVAYSKCNEMDDALTTFSTMPGTRNVVLWTALISGYLQNGGAARAVDLFRQMTRDGVYPNSFTYSVILTAHPFVCPSAIHAQVIKTNYERTSTVGTALLDAYFKEGNSDAATEVFDSIEEKDIVSWSAILAGYAQIGDSARTVTVFMKLGRERCIRPNEYTFSSVINACAGPTAGAEQGRQLHGCSIKSGFSNALVVSSALVTMYAKRGNIENANKVFRRQRERDSVSWNSMISGYAQHGDGKKALEVFEEMKSQNIAMDSVTFIGVISACTHAGLLEEGERYFNMMENHGIKPTKEHYSCMVDLYSRAGMLEKAMEVIRSMPFPASATSWLSILAGCRAERNLELGKVAAERLMSLQPDHSAAYVLLSNIYAASGDWDERREVRRMMEERRVKKEAGLSWIEVKNKTHSFLAGDVSHPLASQIYAKLDELRARLRDAGYRPDTNYVLHDVEEEHKEAILSQHSERLALAFGLISTSSEAPIQIMKNLRVCRDCHTVFKMVSEIEGREIVVRDSNRFHHFKGGLCSCGDYW